MRIMHCISVFNKIPLPASRVIIDFHIPTLNFFGFHTNRFHLYAHTCLQFVLSKNSHYVYIKCKINYYLVR